MGRVVGNGEFDRINIRGDNGGTVALVRGGRKAYLGAWPAISDGQSCVAVCGPATLRALARAILKEVPPRRKVKRAR